MEAKLVDVVASLEKVPDWPSLNMDTLYQQLVDSERRDKQIGENHRQRCEGCSVFPAALK